LGASCGLSCRRRQSLGGCKADFSAKTLTDGSGNRVAISIDPFYFSVPVIP